MVANMYKPSEKKVINRFDYHEQCPASIKSTIQWFPFHIIMEHTGNIMQDDKHLISSLIKMFSMFEIILSYGEKDFDTLSLQCINCKRETGLDPETTFTWVYDEIITKFVLNAILHHVGMPWIITSNQEMEYEINTKNNHLDWLNKGPWYNKNICSKLHGINFEDFITQAKIDRYNLMCSLVAHDRLEQDYKDNENSFGDRAIPNDATIKTLESLGATFNFIDICHKHFRGNHCARSESYSNDMEEMFKQIPQNVERALTSKEKNTRNDDRYWWLMVLGRKF